MFFLKNRLKKTHQEQGKIDEETISYSSVILEQVEIIGGKGGEGDTAQEIEPEVDGQPIYADENSTIQYSSDVKCWEVFE